MQTSISVIPSTSTTRLREFLHMSQEDGKKALLYSAVTYFGSKVCLIPCIVPQALVMGISITLIHRIYHWVIGRLGQTQFMNEYVQSLPKQARKYGHIVVDALIAGITFSSAAALQYELGWMPYTALKSMGVAGFGFSLFSTYTWMTFKNR